MKWLLIIGCWLSVSLVGAQEVHIPLHDGWTFCQVGKEQWYPAEVPGVVHTDLLRNGLIPDPYLGSNVDSVQWIENEAWIYKRTIIATDTLLKHGHLDLVFKGLDTFAEVYLNDSLLFKADNMFRTWEWPVKELLRKGANELKVIFRSPIKEGAKLRDAYGIQLPHDNDPTGVSPYIRKAAYQFGWDFCPRLVTSGIWQGVELRGWSNVRIAGIYFRENAGRPYDLLIEPDLIRDGAKALRGSFEIWFDDSLVSRIRTAHFRRQAALAVVKLGENTKRWWPNGSGEQPIHQLRILIRQKRKVICSWERSHAIRTIEWSPFRSPDQHSFSCSVNGETIFMKGCNLIPPKMILAGDQDSAWVAQVAWMRRVGMNMVRVWAGGIYPPEAFYNACDTAGILVWQDFMLANLVPPTKEMKQNLFQEAAQQVQRTTGHPCIALYCGNNELNVAWENWGWQERYNIHGNDSVRLIQGNWEIWDHIIGFWSRLVPYTPTSPLSNWGNAEGLTRGDLHYWGVWHGDSAFSSFKNNVGRFVSEYGFQSYPDSALLAKYIDPKELYLGSPAVQRLQRSYKTDKPIWDAVEHELGEEKPTTLGGFIEASQRVQAKAYGLAIEAHMAAKPHCMGTLLWQLNDCWPGPSWSIIDYEGRPKPAYEVVRSLYLKAP